MEMVEVEFTCIKCGRIAFEHYPENTNFDKLNTDFEHDFDCSQLDEEEQDID